MKYSQLIAAFLFLLIPFTSTAQDFVPDRPGIGNGSFITPTGILGVETGASLTGGNDVTQTDLGQILMRYGVTGKLELRALLNSYSIVSFNDENESGFQDIGLGLKWNLISGGQARLSALAEVSLPTGSEFFTADQTIPLFGLITDISLGTYSGVSVNLNYTPSVSDVERSWLLTVTPGFSIPSNSAVSVYAGYAGRFNEISPDLSFLEAGLAFTNENGVQFDLNSGYELEFETYFIGAGVAFTL
jgi:hypothetical protein